MLPPHDPKGLQLTLEFSSVMVGERWGLCPINSPEASHECLIDGLISETLSKLWVIFYNPEKRFLNVIHGLAGHIFLRWGV